MLNIALPTIAIEPASNGYIIQWKRPTTKEEEKQSSNRFVTITAIALTDDQLVEQVKVAISALAVPDRP
jgi:4-hydroxy-3-methylbut-2-enyl diphosphate reductase IspH